MFQLPERVPVRFCDSKGPFVTLLSPNDQKPISQIQYATSEDIEKLLTKIRGAQKKFSNISPLERSTILKKIASLIHKDAERLAWLIATEGGKPLRDARVEVARAQTTFEICAEETLNPHREIISMNRTQAALGHEAYTIREPIGPVLAISAFNHPLNLLAHQVGCALASGCVVVVKPAPSTPLCAFELDKIFSEAGLPHDALIVVNAEIPQVETLVKSSVFGYLNFIGSAKVGWNLRRSIAPGTRIGLEHGGQAPAVVAADADLDKAVSALIKGAFYHAGQVCISTQRIFVHQSLYQKFCDKFVAATKNLVVGDARREDTDVGPLIRKAEVTRLLGWIDESLQTGAKVLCGKSTQGDGQYLMPTVLASVPRSTRIMREEAFGPVVCLNFYQDFDELLEYLNQNEYIFESCIFSQDQALIEKFALKMNSMTVVINNHNAFRVDWMPFGGHGLSGLGMGGVKYLMEEMTRLKQVIRKIN